MGPDVAGYSLPWPRSLEGVTHWAAPVIERHGAASHARLGVGSGRPPKSAHTGAMRTGVFLMSPHRFPEVYGPEQVAEVRSLLDIPKLVCDPAQHGWAEPMRHAQVMVSGWGAPRLDSGLLDRMPNLELVLYGAGTVRGIVTEEFWERGIALTTAREANAVPVVEYTLAAILLSLKHFWRSVRLYRQQRSFPEQLGVPGGYGSTVGLVSLGSVGRQLAERLRPLDLRVLAYDPFLTQEQAVSLGVEKVSLEEVFRLSDVVSMHTPWLKETEGMVGAHHFRLMKRGSTFINTARGAVVDEQGLVEVFSQRDDLFAVLDVTYPEPPNPDSPLWEMPNVVLSPHIAGSMGPECRRMGQMMVEELRRWICGEPLLYAITQESYRNMA